MLRAGRRPGSCCGHRRPGRARTAARRSPRWLAPRWRRARARGAPGPRPAGRRVRASRARTTAALPMATPCSLAPISAPHIQNGRLSISACVRRTCGITRQVQRSVAPGACSRAAIQPSTCASLGSRSQFLAKITRSGLTATKTSDMAVVRDCGCAGKDRQVVETLHGEGLRIRPISQSRHKEHTRCRSKPSTGAPRSRCSRCWCISRSPPRRGRHASNMA
jgi:hypothetical protein